MEKLAYKFNPMDEYHVQADFPDCIWQVVLKGIKRLKPYAGSISQLTGFNVSEIALSELEFATTEALHHSEQPIFNISRYDTLADSLVLLDRRSPFISFNYLTKESFSSQEFDLKDQINLHVWWNEDGSIMQLPEYEQFICLNRFDNETLSNRDKLFSLFGRLGFMNTTEGWSGNKRLIPEDYFNYEEDFYWKTTLGFHNANVLEAEIGIIVKPTDMTFLPMVSLGCVVGCCAKPLQTYQASVEGINEMMMEIEHKAYHKEIDG